MIVLCTQPIVQSHVTSHAQSPLHELLAAQGPADHRDSGRPARAVDRGQDNAARQFYLKYGFVFLRDDPHHLFLPIQVIRQLRLPPL